MLFSHQVRHYSKLLRFGELLNCFGHLQKGGYSVVGHPRLQVLGGHAYVMDSAFETLCSSRGRSKVCQDRFNGSACGFFRLTGGKQSATQCSHGCT